MVNKDPGKYKCYPLTNKDLAYVRSLNEEGYNETMAEAVACEKSYGNVYSMGMEELAPGCGKCTCCKLRTDGKFKHKMVFQTYMN